MTYKEFSMWCNKRACDGMWSYNMAIICSDMMIYMRRTPIWRRRKAWEAIEPLATHIVERCKQHYCGARMDLEGNDG